ncbi:MAG: sigma-70 family RNA polymerase sigma factor [Clostridia bacterium]|jgi:RNA polymerase sigma-70 factor (ECF subfamily)|nr:sigma-70 family RNA polymerase sigma factor [Clostridia bacterium]
MEFVQGPDRLSEKNELFEQLVFQYQTALLRFCYLYLRDQEQARDAVQETFFKAYRNWQSFRGDSGEKTWLMSIALNTCHDMRKSAWFRHVDRRVTPDDLPPASVPFTAKEEELITQVMELPPKLREVILLYYYQAMNVNEIAETLGISHSSVSERLNRARGKLRDALTLERRDDL